MEGGTQETLFRCIKQRKPYKLIDTRETSSARTAELTGEFIYQKSIGILNVAGPRASKWPEAYEYTLETIDALIKHFFSDNH